MSAISVVAMSKSCFIKWSDMCERLNVVLLSIFSITVEKVKMFCGKFTLRSVDVKECVNKRLDSVDKRHYRCIARFE